MTTPRITDGPASVYLKLAAALAALIAAVSAVVHGDHSETTLAAGLTAAAFLVTFAAGRYAQATALIRHAPVLVGPAVKAPPPPPPEVV